MEATRRCSSKRIPTINICTAAACPMIMTMLNVHNDDADDDDDGDGSCKNRYGMKWSGW